MKKYRLYIWTTTIRLFAWFVVVCGYVVTFFTYCYYDSIFFEYPQYPDPTTLRTIPYEVKNRIVYVTPDERATVHWLGWATFVLLGLICVFKLIDEEWPLPATKGKNEGDLAD
jgi:hypothetical protein